MADQLATQGDAPSSAVLDEMLQSIDVEGLTAGSIQECLSKLDIRREEAMIALMSHAASTYGAPADTASPNPALDFEAKTSAALARLHDLGLATDESTAQVASLAAQHAPVAAELQTTLASAAKVGVIAGLHQRLQEYDNHVSQGQFTAAAAIATELEGAATAVPGAEDTVAMLKERVRVLKDHLVTAPPQYLIFDPATHVPALYPPAEQTAAALGEMWQAAEALSVLQEALAGLATSILEQSIKPVLASEATIAAAEAAGVMDSPAGSVASSALSAATTARGAARAGTERSIYKTLKVVSDGALGGRPDLARQLGETLWPAAAGAYIAAKLRPLRPQNDVELDMFVRAGSLAVKLEQKALKLELLPSEIEGPIAKFVRQTVTRVLGDKRSRYAVAARDLLASQAAKETTIVHGDAAFASGRSTPRALFDSQNSSFKLSGVEAAAASELEGEHAIVDVGPYAVTRAAEGIAALMHEALTEACRSGSPALAQAMCGAVVDMASLLIALDPAASPQELLLPYLAAVRHNDCLHVYRTLCALPQAHAPRLQALVHRAVNFVAPAQRVRSAGDAALGAMLEHQREELAVVAAGLTRWRGAADAQEVIRSRKAVQQLLTAFQRFGTALRGVLPRRTFVHAAAQLLNPVCGRIADAILAMDDISEEESQQIPSLLEDLIAPTAGLIGAVAGNPAAEAQHENEKKEGSLAAEVAAAALEVSRLREVCELLDVPSREIARRWLSGRLQSVGLSKEQVSHLVMALFEDTEFRQKSLQAIASAP